MLAVRVLSNDAHAATYSDVPVVPTQLTRLGFLCPRLPQSTRGTLKTLGYGLVATRE